MTAVAGVLLLGLVSGCSNLPAGPSAGRVPDTINSDGRTRYLLYQPADYPGSGEKAWPLVMFLHGAGERGTDIELVKKHGIPRLVASGVDFPFLVASPQCPAGQTWSPAMVGRVLDDVCRKVRVDRDRIYLTGLSMGGYGTWFTAIAYPDRFAAIVPICGGGDPGAACRLRDLPVWVFHGAKDPVVQPEESARMVEALRGCGGNVRFTLYPEAEHDCWTQTYQNPELYRWLLQQTRPAQM